MKTFLVGILITLSLGIFGQENTPTIDCSHLKKGKYIMTGPSGGEIRMIRRKKTQFERYNREHQKYRFKIEWTSDCSYTLTLKKVKGKRSAKDYIGSKVYVTIIAAKEDYYTAKSKTEEGVVTEIEITKIR